LCNLKSTDSLWKISTYELLNQQHESHYIRTIPISASMGFSFKGFSQWNFSLKVLMKTGSFMQFLLCTKYRIGTVEYYVHTESQVSITIWLYIFLTKTNARHPYFRPPFIIFESVIWSSFNQCEKSCFFILLQLKWLVKPIYSYWWLEKLSIHPIYHMP